MPSCEEGCIQKRGCYTKGEPFHLQQFILSSVPIHCFLISLLQKTRQKNRSFAIASHYSRTLTQSDNRVYSALLWQEHGSCSHLSGFHLLIIMACLFLQPTLPCPAHLCERHSPSALCQMSFCRSVGYETHPVSSIGIVPFGPIFFPRLLKILVTCVIRWNSLK